MSFVNEPVKKKFSSHLNAADPMEKLAPVFIFRSFQQKKLGSRAQTPWREWHFWHALWSSRWYGAWQRPVIHPLKQDTWISDLPPISLCKMAGPDFKHHWHHGSLYDRTSMPGCLSFFPWEARIPIPWLWQWRRHPVDLLHSSLTRTYYSSLNPFLHCCSV